MALISGVKDFFGGNYDYKRDTHKKLNLLGVAEAHIVLKSRLWHHIQGGAHESLEAALFDHSGACQLGNWINGNELGHLCGVQEFEQLNEAHRQFHRLGTLIVEKLKAGDRGGASEIFKDGYNTSLRNMIQSLTWLNRHLYEN